MQKIYIFVLSLSVILISCDGISNNSPEYAEDSYEDEIIIVNNIFNDNNIDIKVKGIRPASQNIIDNLKRHNYNELSKLKFQKPYSKENIKWNKTKLLSIESHDMVIAITAVGESSGNGDKYLYSLMNSESIFNQFINIIPYSDDASLNENFRLQFTLTNLDGSCLFKDEKTNRKVTSIDSPLIANSEEEGCWSSCVEETISEGSATFLLACMATGPYCAAAIAIACAGHCVAAPEKEEV